ncbi:MAG: YbfB/YjiJ family MFS transporter [Rhodospirillales bacterium]|nr:MAG: YbfB/YjiJ family MFS transporter [Rhodospirillales bacterium]
MNDSGHALVSDRGGIRRLAFVGLAGGLIGVGICRFAFTPLVPVMIGEGWITPVEAGYLGAINFAGYFLGAVMAWPLQARLGAGRAVRLNLLLCLLSLAAAALPLGYPWLAVWRFVAGYGGAVLIVLVGPAVLALTPAAHWGAITGMIFTGVGAGVAATGTLVPLLAGLGASAAWLGLAGAVLVLSALAHAFWREPPEEGLTPPTGEAPARMTLPAILLCFSYATVAIGIAPHSVLWVDYLARELSLGIAVGGAHWTVIGLLAAATPFALGRIADRFGFARVLAVAMVISTVATLFPVAVQAPDLQIVSSVLFGLTMPGTVALFAGRAGEVGGRHGQRRLWWLMTLFFALTQAGGFYGLSALFEATHAYLPLFAIAGAILVVGTVAVLPVWARADERR